jgi:hypothetical protein
MREGRSVAEVMRDYLSALALTRQLPQPLAAKLRGYQRFLDREGHHLAREPGALYSLALAQPEDSPVHRDARDGKGRPPERPWFRLRNPPTTDPNPALKRTLVLQHGAIRESSLVCGRWRPQRQRLVLRHRDPERGMTRWPPGGFSCERSAPR